MLTPSSLVLKLTLSTKEIDNSSMKVFKQTHTDQPKRWNQSESSLPWRGTMNKLIKSRLSKVLALILLVALGTVSGMELPLSPIEQAKLDQRNNIEPTHKRLKSLNYSDKQILLYHHAYQSAIKYAKVIEAKKCTDPDAIEKMTFSILSSIIAGYALYVVFDNDLIATK